MPRFRALNTLVFELLVLENLCMRVIRVVAAAMVLSSCVTPTATVGRSDYKDRCAAYLNLGELDKAELQCQT